MTAEKNFEKLGAFYLGREYDQEAEALLDDLVLYDSKDLTTHAVCVGMTGSGKTGLCVGLLEEAAIDGIPALVIDPKGDLGNLLLTFPDLAPEDFRPWIQEDEAARKGKTPDEFAAQQAELWKNGIGSWGQDGERIRKLKEAADFTIYTPGSEAGVPVSVLASFGAPPQEVVEDGDLFRDRIESTVTSLLALLGIKADPIRSREHILLSNILDRLWREGRDVDLGGLIQAIQKPPIEKVGVLDLESFFPADDRFELAMALNNLLASPTFQAWLEGEPLDVDQLLYTADGKPRVAIFSIAHLSDPERMFFVSLLLNQTLAWARSRPGTTSLRALVYMDEIFGFLPPVGEPPSKKPMLTLLKQARAFGVGLVLATQNPVDLDYKALSNAGTWFLGRLQTERDKARVLEGLEGAAGGALDKKTMDRMLSGLGKRVFLLHNVHEREPVVFHTRWVLSYLRGPMTRSEIQRLTVARVEPPANPQTSPSTSASAPPERAQVPAVEAKPLRAGGERPVVDPDVPEVFLPASRGDGALVYRPALVGRARVHFNHRSITTDHREDLVLLTDLPETGGTPEWGDAEPLDLDASALSRQPDDGAGFVALPAGSGDDSRYRRWSKELSDSLYRSRRVKLMKSDELDVVSTPGESERDFRIRLRDRAREVRDDKVDTFRQKYESKVRTLTDRIRRAEQKVEREAEQAKHQKLQTAISLGGAVLGALFGRKSLGRASTAARGFSRSSKESQDVRRAEDDVASLSLRLTDLRNEIEAEVAKLTAAYDPENLVFETVQLKPRRTDVDVREVALAWLPYRADDNGLLSQSWTPSS